MGTTIHEKVVALTHHASLDHATRDPNRWGGVDFNPGEGKIVRLLIEDDDGTVRLFGFDRAMVLVWSASFSAATPFGVIASALADAHEVAYEPGAWVQ